MRGLNFHIQKHSALAESYGYDAYENHEAWLKGFHGLIAQLDALEAKGLAGYVYTQLTDIEEETNGLLTYDRRVHKLLADTSA